MQHLDGMTIEVSLPLVGAGSMCGASPALSPAASSQKYPQILRARTSLMNCRIDHNHIFCLEL